MNRYGPATLALACVLLAGSTLWGQQPYMSLTTTLTGNTSTSTGTHMLFDLVTNTNEVTIWEFDHKTTGSPTTVTLYYVVGT